MFSSVSVVKYTQEIQCRGNCVCFSHRYDCKQAVWFKKQKRFQKWNRWRKEYF